MGQWMEEPIVDGRKYKRSKEEKKLYHAEQRKQFNQILWKVTKVVLFVGNFVALAGLLFFNVFLWYKPY